MDGFNASPGAVQRRLGARARPAGGAGHKQKQGVFFWQQIVFFLEALMLRNTVDVRVARARNTDGPQSPPARESPDAASGSPAPGRVRVFKTVFLLSFLLLL